MTVSRAAAVAGSFYPANPEQLRAAVRRELTRSRAERGQSASWPKALIVPHAGYPYSGPVAASAYALLKPARNAIERVVLLGPSHQVAFHGLALPTHTSFDTPLGSIPVDQRLRERLLALRFVSARDDAHHWEHSLEVQLPFLQEVLDQFTLVPVVVGHASPEDVAEALELCWGGDETLIVVSSDLSHYFDYDTAKRMDEATALAIESLRPERIQPGDACGRIPVQGLLLAARHHALEVHRLDLRNSGDTAGPRDEVVGYGAWALS